MPQKFSNIFHFIQNEFLKLINWFFQDEFGQTILNSKTHDSVRYITFLDGTQRILLFTDDRTIGTNSLSRGTGSDSEIILQIHGIGISLVNNIQQMELLYMGFVR